MKTEELNNVYRENLKKLRLKNNFTQSSLAEKVGISDQFYSDIETGKKWGSFDTLVCLADALQVEPYELLLPQGKLISYDSKKTKQLMISLKQDFENLVDTIETYLCEASSLNKTSKFQCNLFSIAQ